MPANAEPGACVEPAVRVVRGGEGVDEVALRMEVARVGVVAAGHVEEVLRDAGRERLLRGNDRDLGEGAARGLQVLGDLLRRDFRLRGYRHRRRKGWRVFCRSCCSSRW